MCRVILFSDNIRVAPVSVPSCGCGLCCCTPNSCSCQGHSEGWGAWAVPSQTQGCGWGALGVAQQLQRPRTSRNLPYSRDGGEVIALGSKKFTCLWQWYLRSTLWSKSYPQQLRLCALGTGLPRANITILILSLHCVLLSWVWVLQSPWADGASHKSGRCWALSSLSEVCVCFSKATEVWVQSPLQSRANSGVFYVLCCSSIGCLI